MLVREDDRHEVRSRVLIGGGEVRDT